MLGGGKTPSSFSKLCGLHFPSCVVFIFHVIFIFQLVLIFQVVLVLSSRLCSPKSSLFSQVVFVLPSRLRSPKSPSFSQVAFVLPTRLRSPKLSSFSQVVFVLPSRLRSPKSSSFSISQNVWCHGIHLDLEQIEVWICIIKCCGFGSILINLGPVWHLAALDLALTRTALCHAGLNVVMLVKVQIN